MAGATNDLFQLELSKSQWTELNGSLVLGTAPTPRFAMGFVASASLVYVFGGANVSITNASTQCMLPSCTRAFPKLRLCSSVPFLSRI